MERIYFVYIMCSLSRVLYIGVTNDIVRRVGEHRGLLPWSRAQDSFARRYNARRLVYVEATPDILSALEREKQLKTWSRARKIGLIEGFNPTWDDLAAHWPEIRMPE